MGRKEKAVSKYDAQKNVEYVYSQVVTTMIEQVIKLSQYLKSLYNTILAKAGNFPYVVSVESSHPVGIKKTKYVI